MDKEFKIMYEELKNEYGNEFKPRLTTKNTKILLYFFIFWLIISTAEYFVGIFSLTQTIIGLVLKLINTIIIFLGILYFAYIMNKNFEYWKTAYKFKKEVGVKFWKKIKSENLYNIEISNEEKKKVEEKLKLIIEKNIVYLNIEEYLECNDFNMYTIKLDDENKKRFNGIFLIINKQSKLNKKDLYNYIEKSEMNISKELKKIDMIENKTYILLDAVELFKFSNKDFFEINELYRNYKRYKEIENLLETKEIF